MDVIMIITCGLSAIVVYAMIYSIIDRICKCEEHKETVRAYGRMVGISDGSKLIPTPGASDKKDA